MAVAPTGMLSLPLSYLRAAISASSNFQTLVGAANAAAALAYIHVAEYESDTPAPPFAVVAWGDDAQVEATSGGTRDRFTRTGSLIVILRTAVDADHSSQDAAYTFLNVAGAILNDVMALSGTAGYPSIKTISPLLPPSRPHEDEKASYGDFFEAAWRIEYWGIA